MSTILKNEQLKNNFVINNVDSRKDINMSEEIKEEQKKEKCECSGKCKCVKVFLLGILASFLGCILALLIFSAATKPSIPPSPMMFGPPHAQQFHHGKFKHGHFKKMRPEFRKEFRGEKFKKDFDREMSPREQKSDFIED